MLHLLAQAEANLQRAEANVAKMQVSAPVAGMAVVQEIFRSGDMVRIRAGDQLRSQQRCNVTDRFAKGHQRSRLRGGRLRSQDRR